MFWHSCALVAAFVTGLWVLLLMTLLYIADVAADRVPPSTVPGWPLFAVSTPLLLASLGYHSGCYTALLLACGLCVAVTETYAL